MAWRLLHLPAVILFARRRSVGQQMSEGKSGVRSSSRKQATANRGGMHEMPQTRRVAGAFGKDGRERKTPARAPAAGKVPSAGRRRVA